jgi:hypothetical protein
MDSILLYSALAVCLGCLFRCYVPPQVKQLRDALDRIAGLEDAYEAVAQRLTKRAKAENLEGARAVRETRKQRGDELADEALALIQNAKAQQTGFDFSTESGRAAAKAHYRGTHLMGKASQ